MIKKIKMDQEREARSVCVPVRILSVLLLDGGQASLLPSRGFAEENLKIEKIYK